MSSCWHVRARCIIVVRGSVDSVLIPSVARPARYTSQEFNPQYARLPGPAAPDRPQSQMAPLGEGPTSWVRRSRRLSGQGAGTASAGSPEHDSRDASRNHESGSPGYVVRARVEESKRLDARRRRRTPQSKDRADAVPRSKSIRRSSSSKSRTDTPIDGRPSSERARDNSRKPADSRSNQNNARSSASARQLSRTEKQVGRQNAHKSSRVRLEPSSLQARLGKKRPQPAADQPHPRKKAKSTMKQVRSELSKLERGQKKPLNNRSKESVLIKLGAKKPSRTSQGRAHRGSKPSPQVCFNPETACEL